MRKLRASNPKPFKKEISLVEWFQMQFHGQKSKSICPTFFNHEPKQIIKFRELNIFFGQPDDYEAFGFVSEESRRIVCAFLITPDRKQAILDYIDVDYADRRYIDYITKDWVY